jgi:hypothetical protein
MLNIDNRFDNFGRVRGAGIHDATVVGFTYALDARFTLILSACDGSNSNLSFDKVEEIGFSNFTKGAIVSDIFCWPLKALDVTPAIREAYSILASENYVENDCVRDIDRLATKYSDSLLVYISCSYGGDVALVCKEVQRCDCDVANR